MKQGEDNSFFNGEKKILIISHTYNDFIKDSSEALSPYFDKMNVIINFYKAG